MAPRVSRESGITQKTVCKDLGISKSALQAWVRDAKFQSHGMTPSRNPEAVADHPGDRDQQRERDGRVRLTRTLNGPGR
ncbi:transposase [Microbacterium lacticum]